MGWCEWEQGWVRRCGPFTGCPSLPFWTCPSSLRDGPTLHTEGCAPGGPMTASDLDVLSSEASSRTFPVPTPFGLTPSLVPFWAWLGCSSLSPGECHCPQAPRACCHMRGHGRGCVCPSLLLSRKQVTAAAWLILGTFVNSYVSLSHVWLFATPLTVAHQASPSMDFSGQEILEWVAIPFSRGPSLPRDQTQVSGIGGGSFTTWATREHL